MRTALALLLVAGCATVQDHPIGTVTIANSALVVGAGACAIDCHDGAARDVSEGALVAEMVASSTLAILVWSWVFSYAAEGGR